LYLLKYREKQHGSQELSQDKYKAGNKKILADPKPHEEPTAPIPASIVSAPISSRKSAASDGLRALTATLEYTIFSRIAPKKVAASHVYRPASRNCQLFTGPFIWKGPPWQTVWETAGL
jgi:hypothetical protein